jgi:uncharacterized protein (UPF0332 family)
MLDPQHLLDLAKREAKSNRKGAPRQADLRRAVSTAYYAAFHELCGAVADAFVPAHSTRAKTTFYQALGHGELRSRCEDLAKKTLPKRLVELFGVQSLPIEAVKFCRTFVELQELRHACDYDPEYVSSLDEAETAIRDAEEAIGSLGKIDTKVRLLLLAYLLNGSRG